MNYSNTELFQYSQAQNGFIYLLRGERFTRLTNFQILELAIPVKEIRDFDLEKYEQAYSKECAELQDMKNAILNLIEVAQKKQYGKM